MTAHRDLKGNETYAVTLMVPPGNLNYFYQAIDDSPGVNGSEAAVLTDMANPTFNAPEFQVKLDHGTVEVPKLNYRDDIDIVEKTLHPLELVDLRALVRPKKDNVVRVKHVKKQKAVEDEDSKKAIAPVVLQEEVVIAEEQATAEVKQAEPEVDNYFDEDDEERRRKEAAKYWSLKNSLFANFKQDTQDLCRQCFEFDWKMSKIESMLKNVTPGQKSSIYGFLRSNYDYIKEAYRCFAGMNAISNVCCIPTPILTYIAQNCPNLIDNKTLRLADLDLEFIATKAGASKIKTNMNPER